MAESVKIWDAVPGNEWDEERELKEQPTWAADLSHSWPRLMAMEGWFWMKYMNAEYAYWSERLCKPTVRGALRRIRNGADYVSFIPIRDEEEVKRREVKFKENVITLCSDFAQWWQKAKEELIAKYNELKGFDLETASNTELLNHLYDLMDTARRAWWVHWRGLLTVSNAWVLLEDLFKELWGLNDLSPEFQRLMSGYDNKMLQVDKRMWELGRSAVAKGIADIIVNTEPKELFQKLEQNKVGKEWLKDFKNFLDEDGWRIAHLHVFHEPTWVEDPSPAIDRIKGFIQKGDVEWAMDKKRGELVKEREETLATLLTRVPKERKDEFLKLLAAAQLAGAFNEEHTYYCENYCHGLIRRGLLGIGRRLVETVVIDRAEDILLLNPPEVERVMPGPYGCNLRYIVDRRRREWEEWHKMDAPPLITARSSIPEAFAKDISLWKEAILDKIVAGSPPEMKTALKADLYGLAGSAGVVEGPARVVIAAEQLAELKVGEILVAPFTTTTWTPVFALIKGVVTDVGGPLCHTAIVSREYKIPAVINTGEGTKKIKTGQRIRVDGSEGVVYILG
jgi:pyruvate,water dikinase